MARIHIDKIIASGPSGESCIEFALQLCYNKIIFRKGLQIL